MNNHYFYASHAAISIALYVFSLWISRRFSGYAYTKLKELLALGYNLTIGPFHFHFAKTGSIPFLGVFEKHVMGWLSMVMVILHAASYPTEETRRSWLKRKNSIHAFINTD